MSPWLDRLHDLRRREIEIIFDGMVPKQFGLGLELGAGDGFQSAFLAKYLDRLISTDINFSRLSLARESPAQLIVCDAQEPERAFRPNSFDLVFSSNLLEHIPDTGRTLKGIRTLLRPGGMSIHVMPSAFMKLTWMVLFYPNKIYRLWRILTRSNDRSEVEKKLAGIDDDEWENNPLRDRPGFLRRQLWPVPHGAYRSNWSELLAYRPQRWVRVFERSGFRVTEIKKMPVTTGYTFGLGGLERWLELVGLASSYAYFTISV